MRAIRGPTYQPLPPPPPPPPPEEPPPPLLLLPPEDEPELLPGGVEAELMVRPRSAMPLVNPLVP